MKGRIYHQSSVRPAMLYRSESFCLRENEMAILKRTEKAMTSAMWGGKLIKKKSSQELVSLLDLEESERNAMI